MFNDFTVYNVLSGHDERTFYDVNVVLPVYPQGKYLRRLEAFKRCGLYGLARSRVHLTLLGTRGDWAQRNALVQGWPEGVHVSFLEMGSAFAVPKFNGYYLWLRESGLRSRWLLRVDDDSITDVDGLLAAADAGHSAAAVHLMSSPQGCTEIALHIRDRLETLGAWGEDLRHETESSLTSRRAMEAVFADTRAVDFLSFMARTTTRPGDQGLACAMRIAGVAAVDNPVSTKECLLDQLTLTGGPLCHVHAVNWEDAAFVQRIEALIREAA